MDALTHPNSFTVWLVVALFALLRYLLFAGGAFLFFYVWKRRAYLHKRIQAAFPDNGHLRQEFLYSLSTFAIFGLVGVCLHYFRERGYTFMYQDISQYGWLYFVLSIPLTIVIHDAYFYFTHRAMHWQPIYKYVHRVHHLSTNPSPWAAFSFHPLEAVVEAGIIPVLAFVIPLHSLALLVFMVYMVSMNVLGHLGFELFPTGFTRHWLGRWSNTSTHHNLHHKYFKGNYGLYFNWWDQLLGTNQARYHESFEAVAERRADVRKENLVEEPLEAFQPAAG